SRVTGAGWPLGRKEASSRPKASRSSRLIPRRKSSSPSFSGMRSIIRTLSAPPSLHPYPPLQVLEYLGSGHFFLDAEDFGTDFDDHARIDLPFHADADAAALVSQADFPGNVGLAPFQFRKMRRNLFLHLAQGEQGLRFGGREPLARAVGFAEIL